MTPVVIGIILKRSSIIFSFRPPNNIVKEDWSVGRPLIFHPGFSSASTVLFLIQKNHYIAIYFWKDYFFTCYFDHKVNPTVPDLSISSPRASDISCHWVLSLFTISMCMDSAISVLSNIQDNYWLVDPFFFCFFVIFYGDHSSFCIVYTGFTWYISNE